MSISKREDVLGIGIGITELSTTSGSTDNHSVMLLLVVMMLVAVVMMVVAVVVVMMMYFSTKSFVFGCDGNMVVKGS